MPLDGYVSQLLADMAAQEDAAFRAQKAVDRFSEAVGTLGGLPVVQSRYVPEGTVYLVQSPDGRRMAVMADGRGARWPEAPATRVLPTRAIRIREEE